MRLEREVPRVDVADHVGAVLRRGGAACGGADGGAAGPHATTNTKETRHERALMAPLSSRAASVSTTCASRCALRASHLTRDRPNAAFPHGTSPAPGAVHDDGRTA